MHADADPHPPTRPSDLLLSPLLLASAALLVVNDWMLKPAFHNAVTGKLSDVAGMAALALFLRAVLPRRRALACVLAGAAFAWWKSPASQPVIDGWNALGWWTAARVVDWTDLAALLVLPIAFAYRPRPVRSHGARRVLAPAAGAACVLAFAATSAPRQTHLYPVGAEHAFADSPQALAMRMYDLRIGYVDRGVPPVTRGPVDTLHLYLGEHGNVLVQAELRAAAGGSVVRLLEASVHPTSVTADSARRVFEREVIGALRENRADENVSDMTGGAAVWKLDPRVVAPRALFEPRDTVRVSVARPAYLALVEITPQVTWHVIFPVTDADERRFAAGEHALVTRCAAEPRGEPVSPGREVPPCAVARRVTAEDARALGTNRHPTCDEAPRGSAIASGALLVIAADAPIRRASLEEAVRGQCGTGAWFGMGKTFLDTVLRRSGVREWGVREAVLRR
jgi:hypothetical protein